MSWCRALSQIDYGHNRHCEDCREVCLCQRSNNAKGILENLSRDMRMAEWEMNPLPPPPPPPYFSKLSVAFSLRSKRFRLVSEKRKTEERDLGFGRARNETRAKNPLPALLLTPFFARSLTLAPRSLLLNCRETLATQATSPFKDSMLREGGGCILNFPFAHLYIMHLVCSPKFCITVVLNFSWDRCNTQEKLKTKIMQSFLGERGRGANKMYYGRRGNGE